MIDDLATFCLQLLRHEPINPKLIFDADLQKEAALAVIKANEELAAILGINPAARTTVVKPDGNTSQMLGTSSTPGDFR